MEIANSQDPPVWKEFFSTRGGKYVWADGTESVILNGKEKGDVKKIKHKDRMQIRITLAK